MWKRVFGAQCHVYGIDINPAVNKFTDQTTTITIGDQADMGMWQSFFAETTKAPIDALIDDGGHESHQMLVTLRSVFDNLTPGGIIGLEDSQQKLRWLTIFPRLEIQHGVLYSKLISFNTSPNSAEWRTLVIIA